jgi:hypothetical protein
MIPYSSFFTPLWTSCGRNFDGHDKMHFSGKTTMPRTLKHVTVSTTEMPRCGHFASETLTVSQTNTRNSSINTKNDPLVRDPFLVLRIVARPSICSAIPASDGACQKCDLVETAEDWNNLTPALLDNANKVVVFKQ